MKIALITTPPSVRSGIGDYTRHLLPYLRELADVEAFVEHGADEEEWGDLPVHLARDLDPRGFDQVLYQLGNEQSHAFMARMVRAIGGTVMQHDWVLFDLAMAAWPALARGGAKGHALALREGGLGQARVYGRNWLDRRRQRSTPYGPAEACELAQGSCGTILSGWHEPEEAGRWSSDYATFRLPGEAVTHVNVEAHATGGRRVYLLRGDERLGELRMGRLEARFDAGDRPVLSLETRGVRVTTEQRANGDSRRLGCFVRRVSWTDGSGEHDLDLSASAAVPNVPVSLSRDRFRLPLNRSIVRFADAFLVHSEWVRDRILAERNARTAIGIVHHGSEIRWRDEDRRQIRARLGLPRSWIDGFLVTSFGGVQPHKRIDKALHALARARAQSPNLHMVLAGSMHSEEFDPRQLVEKLGLSEAVRFTGYVPEEVGWDWLHAGDLALNLRGPSSGGTSGGIFQAFSMGRPVVVSDAYEQRELPEACVIKVPAGDDEIPILAQTLIEIADDEDRRNRLEECVREFVRHECHWGRVAAKYVDHLEGFPRVRVSRRRLVALKLALGR